MVFLSSCVLEKSREYKRTYKPRKPVSRLSKKEIIDYLSETEIPRHIASPLPRTRNGVEFIEGETGDLIYSGMMGVGESLMRRNAYRDGEYVRYNTYFNRVLEQAVKRGIIKLYDAGSSGIFLGNPFMLSDVLSLQLNRALKELPPNQFLEDYKRFKDDSRKIRITARVAV